MVEKDGFLLEVLYSASQVTIVILWTSLIYKQGCTHKSGVM